MFYLKMNKLHDEDFDAYTASIKELAAQIIQLSPNMPAEASIILKILKILHSL